MRRCDHGSLVVKVTDSLLECREFEPRTTEDPPYRGGRCSLNMSRLKNPPVSVVWKLGKKGRQLRCCPRHLTMVQNYEVRRQRPSFS
ncbi:hypothetical protein TNCV_4045321 [Trichonephila clavipes]|nr:hypothetical protein TNCV_4045321 [Trichonephila clavipes]